MFGQILAKRVVTLEFSRMMGQDARNAKSTRGVRALLLLCIGVGCGKVKSRGSSLKPLFSSILHPGSYFRVPGPVCRIFLCVVRPSSKVNSGDLMSVLDQFGG